MKKNTESNAIAKLAVEGLVKRAANPLVHFHCIESQPMNQREDWITDTLNAVTPSALIRTDGSCHPIVQAAHARLVEMYIAPQI